MHLILDRSSTLFGFDPGQPTLSGSYTYGFAMTVSSVVTVTGDGAAHTIYMLVGQAGGGSGFTVTTTTVPLSAVLCDG